MLVVGFATQLTSHHYRQTKIARLMKNVINFVGKFKIENQNKNHNKKGLCFCITQICAYIQTVVSQSQWFPPCLLLA